MELLQRSHFIIALLFLSLTLPAVHAGRREGPSAKNLRDQINGLGLLNKPLEWMLEVARGFGPISESNRYWERAIQTNQTQDSRKLIVDELDEEIARLTLRREELQNITDHSYENIPTLESRSLHFVKIKIASLHAERARIAALDLPNPDNKLAQQIQRWKDREEKLLLQEIHKALERSLKDGEVDTGELIDLRMNNIQPQDSAVLSAISNRINAPRIADRLANWALHLGESVHARKTAQRLGFGAH